MAAIAVTKSSKYIRLYFHRVCVLLLVLKPRVSVRNKHHIFDITCLDANVNKFL